MLLKIVGGCICSCKREHCTKLSTERSMIPTHQISWLRWRVDTNKKLIWQQSIWVALFCLSIERSSRPSITSRPSLSKHRVDHRLGVIYAFGNGGHHHNHSLGTLPNLPPTMAESFTMKVDEFVFGNENFPVSYLYHSSVEGQSNCNHYSVCPGLIWNIQLSPKHSVLNNQLLKPPLSPQPTSDINKDMKTSSVPTSLYPPILHPNIHCPPL